MKNIFLTVCMLITLNLQNHAHAAIPPQEADFKKSSHRKSIAIGSAYKLIAKDPGENFLFLQHKASEKYHLYNTATKKAGELVTQNVRCAQFSSDKRRLFVAHGSTLSILNVPAIMQNNAAQTVEYQHKLKNYLNGNIMHLSDDEVFLAWNVSSRPRNHRVALFHTPTKKILIAGLPSQSEVSSLCIYKDPTYNAYRLVMRQASGSIEGQVISEPRVQRPQKSSASVKPHLLSSINEESSEENLILN